MAIQHNAQIYYGDELRHIIIVNYFQFETSVREFIFSRPSRVFSLPFQLNDGDNKEFRRRFFGQRERIIALT